MSWCVWYVMVIAHLISRIWRPTQRFCIGFVHSLLPSFIKLSLSHATRTQKCSQIRSYEGERDSLVRKTSRWTIRDSRICVIKKKKRALKSQDRGKRGWRKLFRSGCPYLGIWQASERVKAILSRECSRSKEVSAKTLMRVLMCIHERRGIQCGWRPGRQVQIYGK